MSSRNRVVSVLTLGAPGPPPKMGLGWVPGGSNTTEPEEMGQEPWGEFRADKGAAFSWE